MSEPIYHPEIEQGTDPWREIKAGHWSASEAATIMGGTDTKGLPELVKRVALERFTGRPVTSKGYKSAAMEHGTLTEPVARDWYAFREFAVVEQVGFVQHARIPWVGWSPDGLLLGRRRAIEAKCPQYSAFMDVLRTREVPACYRWQCRWACWVGKLDGLDFVAYHPDLGGIVIPFEVTGDDCDRMTARVQQLEKQVADWLAILNTHKGNA